MGCFSERGASESAVVCGWIEVWYSVLQGVTDAVCRE